MLYDNNDYRAVIAMETQRLGYDDEEYKICPVCGTENPEEFYTSIQTDECLGCSDCVNIHQWIDY